MTMFTLRKSLLLSMPILALMMSGARAQTPLDPALEQQIKAYILAHPEVIIESLETFQKNSETKALAQRDDIIQREKESLYHDGQSLVLGNIKGKNNVVVYLDHRCGYCKKNWPVVEELLKARSDVRLIVKEYPILGDASVEISRLVLATPEAKKAAYFRALMTFSGTMTQDKALEIAGDLGINTAELKKNAQTAQVSALLQKTEAVAQTLNLTGTPMYIIGDHVIEGGQSLEGFLALVDKAPPSGKDKK
jgi:protein-disulfide isomerase